MVGRGISASCESFRPNDGGWGERSLQYAMEPRLPYTACCRMTHFFLSSGIIFNLLKISFFKAIFNSSSGSASHKKLLSIGDACHKIPLFFELLLIQHFSYLASFDSCNVIHSYQPYDGQKAVIRDLLSLIHFVWSRTLITKPGFSDTNRGSYYISGSFCRRRTLGLHFPCLSTT